MSDDAEFEANGSNEDPKNKKDVVIQWDADDQLDIWQLREWVIKRKI